MFGIVLAMLKRSACSCVPSAAASRARAHEAAQPRDDRAGRHHRAGGEDALALLVGGSASAGHAARVMRGARRRIRRTRRTTIVPKSSADAGAEDHPDHLLTWLERIGSVVGRAERGAVGVGERPASTLWTPMPVGGGVEQDRRALPGARSRSCSGAGDRAVGASVARLEPDRHRLVEAVGDGGREPAAAAGQDDRRGRRRPATEPQSARRSRRASASAAARAASGSRAAGVGRRSVSASSRTAAADLVVAGEQVLQRCRRRGSAPSAAAKLAASSSRARLRVGVGEVVGVDRGAPAAAVDDRADGRSGRARRRRARRRSRRVAAGSPGRRAGRRPAAGVRGVEQRARAASAEDPLAQRDRRRVAVVGPGPPVAAARRGRRPARGPSVRATGGRAVGGTSGRSTRTGVPRRPAARPAGSR